MKAKKISKSQAGFSLIELMVVVAIIGILATIAIPNFNRFSQKAKQSEAKGHLSAIYSGEKAFKAEYDSYIGCMEAVGFVPEGAKILYSAGFGASGVTTVGTAYTAATCTASRSSNFGTAVAVPAAATVTAGATGTFIAAAIAGTTQGFAANDEWRINELRAMTNFASGL